ncbi:hypothetical protein [Streptomyces lasiicapitis]|uniref:hypothetical protein n=1 Tax=Streptomyces lasiicapitis TaxID=1923961 RepID=UPI0036D08EB4
MPAPAIPPAPTPSSQQRPRAFCERIAAVALSALSCLLAVDPLRQLATAMHVSAPFTHLFPLTIDGFIALTVYAATLLRSAPLRVRIYVWTLAGIAIGVHTTAVAAFGVLVNRQSANDVWHLGDVTVVAALACPPLVMLGTIHLYVLITRHITDAARYEEHDCGQVRTQEEGAA